LNTRGIIYLNPQRASDYLAKEHQPKNPNARQQQIEVAVEDARKLLRTIPDGNRILGGYCTDPQVMQQIQQIQELAPNCREQLHVHQSNSNLHGIIFWSLLGATAATGVTMAIGGVAISDGQARVQWLLGWGIPMLSFALTNSIGPFARLQSYHRTIGERIDNYAWTLRQRISVEVCTAPNLSTAQYRLTQIYKATKQHCTVKTPDDGLYELPSH
jgi:hypothetical protein